MSGSIYSGTALSTPGRIAGAASLNLDGDVLDITASSYDAVMLKREEQDGQNAYQGYSEMPKAGSISATVRDNGTMTVASIMAKKNSTMVLTLANGKTVYGDNMACVECTQVNTVEATFEIKFIGTVSENPK